VADLELVAPVSPPRTPARRAVMTARPAAPIQKDSMSAARWRPRPNLHLRRAAARYCPRGWRVARDARFPGQYFDKETNLHYNYFRDYDPAIGRYIQSDPIGLVASIPTSMLTIL